MASFREASLFEHRFWLQILGDHSRFIYGALSPNEKEHIQTAQQFMKTFDQLLEAARSSPSNEELQMITKQADKYAKDIRAFKLELIKEHLTNHLKIHLTPTFLNHMVNEVEEYIRVLGFLVKGQTPPLVHEVHHHLVWLMDAAGHADSIRVSLDEREYFLKDKSDKFRRTFEHFYLRAVEMAGYLRSYVQEFPALSRFNNQVDIEMKVFKEFLHELEEMEMKGEVLDIISPLMADHMAREECYYLIKLAESRGLPKPDCDPAKPRVTNL
ncbi:hypothetical protein JOD45_001861 [Scopulibacillus daqui]|uniref:DUF2935 family protein n=1 Tax=Scopulibacillus daqui TaxID=1469162 RepID=A0ABS2Q013_9BACL|nr:hypothetical protein [Scopulibacillus daqui]